MNMNNHSRLLYLSDRTAIIDVIVGIANAFDTKDWKRLRSFLAQEIEVDYADFRGTPPTRITADTYVSSREAGLLGLTTLHLSMNHEVQVEHDEATCRSAFCIYRQDPQAATGENRLDSAGHYRHHLVRCETRWKVTHIVQSVIWVEGNRALHGAFR